MFSRLRDYTFIIIGCILQALAMDLFLVPGQLAAGGVSGAAQIINNFTGWPIGVMIIIAKTVTIITARAEQVAANIMRDLQRGVTSWPGLGMYSGQERQILFCAISRAEVGQIKAIVHEADPNAFVIIGQAHEALGEGFKPLKQ